MRTLTSLMIASALFAAAPQALAADNAIGEVLTKARDADGMKRVPKESYFEGSGSTALIYFEFKARKEHVKTEFVEFKKDGAGWEGERGYVEFNGSLREVEFATGKSMGNPAPDDMAKGKITDGKLVFTSGKGDSKTVDLPQSPLTPLPVALFVLPAYYEFLPKELPFAIVISQRALDGFKLVKGAEKDGLALVTLLGPGGIKFEIHVSTAAESKGKIVKIVVDGKASKNLGREAGRELIGLMEKAARKAREAAKAGSKPKAGAGATTAKASVEALIQACDAGDMKAAGACFSSKAPREFQSLIDGTCSAKDFKQLCGLFDKAKITGVSADPKNPDVAYVSVKLSSRDEKLTVVKEAGGWKVLDF